VSAREWDADRIASATVDAAAEVLGRFAAEFERDELRLIASLDKDERRAANVPRIQSEVLRAAQRLIRSVVTPRSIELLLADRERAA
jgi:hypothetical protein